jgi:hypothetical protein
MLGAFIVGVGTILKNCLNNLHDNGFSGADFGNTENIMGTKGYLGKIPEFLADRRIRYVSYL